MRNLISRLVLPLCAFISSGSAAICNAQAVTSFGGNAQHTGTYSVPAQDLNSIHWSTTIDFNNSGTFAHYGAPLVTSLNTVIVPVKTSNNGFQVKAFNGATGAPLYTLNTDYILPSYDWIPMYQPVIATSSGGPRLYYAGAGGKLFYISNPDSTAPAAPVQETFYGSVNSNSFNSTVFIDTPLTADANGNVFFGFRVQGAAPAPLNTSQSGFVRIDPNGNATYVLAGTAAADSNIAWDSHNSAPALSNDQSTVYVVAKSANSNSSYACLLGLDATTLATKYKSLLKDPRNGNGAIILDDSTASPMVAPDGDVFFGIFSNPDDGSRGFLLHFTADLTKEKVPGAFGWDFTPGIVPASMVPSYTGTSSYLIFSKYNNYANDGDGNGVNRVAILDPNSTQVDPHPSANGLAEMREVLTVIGVTPDHENYSSTYPHAVREWCINSPAVNPPTDSIFFDSEDGHLYRWNLTTNSLAQVVQLGSGVGEPYVPTSIGPDGTVYTLNGGSMFAVGSLNGASVHVTSSSPNMNAVVAGQNLTFTATVANTGNSQIVPTGTVTFQDISFNGLTPITTDLAPGVPLQNGQAAFSTPQLAAGTHFITATYSGDSNFSQGSMTLLQRIHAEASKTMITASPAPPVTGQPISFAATVSAIYPASGTPTGFVTFAQNGSVAAQLPLNNGTASYSVSSFASGTTISTNYASDSLFGSSSGTWVASSATVAAIGVSPSQGLGMQQVFSAEFADSNGAGDIATAALVIGSQPSATRTCYPFYTPSTNLLYLYNDNGTKQGPITPGSNNTISNGQCRLNGSGSSVTNSGNTLTVNFSISFNSSYAGTKSIYLFGSSATGSSTGYVLQGAWNPADLIAGPVSPSSGSGVSQVFAAQYGDAKGVSDLLYTVFVVGQNNSSGHTCYALYYPATNQFYLYNDNGNVKLGPITPGIQSSLANGQCTLNAVNSSITNSGSFLTLRLALTFNSSYTGSKTIFVLAEPKNGPNTNYMKAGNWIP